jgi:hypothetical protein
MKKGYLSECFEGVAAKRLSAVEADVLRSNQHEFNGVEGLRQLLGEAKGKVPYEAKVLYLSDSENLPVIEDATFTWYDARQKAREERGVMRWEHRLYFPSTTVSMLAAEGDLLVIAKRRDSGLLVIVARKESEIARQIEWLFGFAEASSSGFSVKSKLETERDRLDFVSRFILENIGVEIDVSEERFLEDMIQRFQGKFPETRVFSAYARSTLKDVSPLDDADSVLMAWMDREEVLFRTLERHLISDRLAAGFAESGRSGADVDGFLAFSLSVQNRRKSRVGRALENHIETIFKEQGIRYSRTAITENRSKPDFLFPGISEYRDPDFEQARLLMLGVKSTCKDRWRQVLAEADRIAEKHLLTLEAAISTGQTDEMKAKNLQLVLPRSLHSSYTSTQQNWLIGIADFIDLVRRKQTA